MKPGSLALVSIHATHCSEPGLLVQFCYLHNIWFLLDLLSFNSYQQISNVCWCLFTITNFKDLLSTENVSPISLQYIIIKVSAFKELYSFFKINFQIFLLLVCLKPFLQLALTITLLTAKAKICYQPPNASDYALSTSNLKKTTLSPSSVISKGVHCSAFCLSFHTKQSKYYRERLPVYKCSKSTFFIFKNPI